jgi:hypothetical protein
MAIYPGKNKKKKKKNSSKNKPKMPKSKETLTPGARGNSCCKPNN